MDNFRGKDFADLMSRVLKCTGAVMLILSIAYFFYVLSESHYEIEQMYHLPAKTGYDMEVLLSGVGTTIAGLAGGLVTIGVGVLVEASMALLPQYEKKKYF